MLYGNNLGNLLRLRRIASIGLPTITLQTVLGCVFMLLITACACVEVVVSRMRNVISQVRGFQPYVSVDPLPYFRAPLQKYVRITFIRKNSVRVP